MATRREDEKRERDAAVAFQEKVERDYKGREDMRDLLADIQFDSEYTEAIRSNAGIYYMVMLEAKAWGLTRARRELWATHLTQRRMRGRLVAMICGALPSEVYA